MLFRTLLKRYEALIEDSLYKIQSLNENNIIIPEHVDITGEVDKLLEIIAGAEDKLAAMRKYYGKKKADKTLLQDSVTEIKKIQNVKYSKMILDQIVNKKKVKAAIKNKENKTFVCVCEKKSINCE